MPLWTFEQKGLCYYQLQQHGTTTDRSILPAAVIKREGCIAGFVFVLIPVHIHTLEPWQQPFLAFVKLC